MLKIGLTGGIGSGKSLVAKFLRDYGIIMISADQIAKELVNEDNEIKNKLITEFGTDIYDNDGILDRQKVAEIVFNDEQARRKMNAIVHPQVLKRQKAMLNDIEKSGGVDIACVEAALIFEAGAQDQFDYVIVVHAPYKQVIQRLQQRDQLSEHQIQQRINSQLPVREKIERADYVIKNDRTIADLKKSVHELVIWLRNKL